MQKRKDLSMSKMNERSLVSLFHTLGDETVKQTPIHWNTPRNKDETSSLKVLATNALERLQRNSSRNKNETKDKNFVSQNIPRETKNNPPEKPSLIQLTFLPEEYEERIAIAQYDGQQSSLQAQRIAYQDAFIAVLNALPYKDMEREDWLEERIGAAKEWLLNQGLEQQK